MVRSTFSALFVAGIAQLSSFAHAAPLDALLSANKHKPANNVEIEAGYDVVNDTVDVFGIRDQDKEFSGTTIGDYHGSHFRLGLHLTSDFLLEGGLWQRELDYRQEQVEIESWQLATQYRFMQANGYVPSMAVRLGTWGNSTGKLSKTSPTRFQGATFNTIHVSDVSDQQNQLDLIATWPIQQHAEISAFAGVGTSRVRVGSIDGTGTASRGGCDFNVAYSGTTLILTLARPCGNLRFVRYEEQNSSVYQEVQYEAKYVHAGVSGKWSIGPWSLGAGYQYQQLNRDNIDDLIEQRGGKPIKANHTLISEVAYKLTKYVSVFGRGQYMAQQFTGEIPMAYNTFTAHRFNKHYGFVSTGLVIHF